MRNFIISLLLCAMVILLLTSNDTSAKGFGAQSFSLDNGMQVVVIPNTKVPAVSHMVWYKIGAQDEPLGKSGVAHFLEHLMFKGTKRYGPGEFSKTIAKAGGNDNAFTGADFTAYFQNISRDKLELVMDMEADRMQNIVITQEDVLKERDVILEERSSRTDNKPAALLREQMKAALFLNHPYKRPIIGWRHEMEQLSLQDARKWYEDYYTPNNAVLIVSGDITAQELKPLAEKYYGKLQPRKTPPQHNIYEPNRLSPTRISLTDEKVTKPEWSRYYVAPSRNTPLKQHCTPLTILSYILGGSNTSRLYQNMVVEKQSAVSVGTYYDDIKRGKSIFGIYGVPTNGSSLDEVEAQIEQHIRDIQQNGVTIGELEQAKKAIIAEMIYAREDLKTLAYFYGQLATTGIGIDYADKLEDDINSVTLEQIKLAANEVLQIENSVTGQLLVQKK